VSLSDLPALNAALNSVATVLLVVGRAQIRAGRRTAHERTMLLATLVSALFLAGYLTYHFAVVPELGHTPFRRAGAVKVAYYGLLISHVVLAAVNLPMVLWTLFLAFRGRWDAHRRMARVTWPVWLYVSVTGVLVYLALYHWNPPA
jgi:uncharacterized membrane protein YozB (DUF420 family)